MISRVLARLWPEARRLNVYGVCPQTGVRVPTYAHMSEAELKRFDRKLALFCPACRRAHQFAHADLSLDSSGVAEA